MKRLLLLCLLSLIVPGCKIKKAQKERICSRVDLETVLALFPKTVEELQHKGDESLQTMQDVIKDIDSIKPENRTFFNTIRSYDAAKFDFMTTKQVFDVMQHLSADKQMQSAAKKQFKNFDAYQKDTLDKSVELYTSLDEYQKFGKDTQRKSPGIKHFLNTLLRKFEYNGLHIPVVFRSELYDLQKDVDKLVERYRSNVVHDQTKISIASKDLKGVSKLYLQTLKQDSYGNYVVPVSSLSYSHIMQNCMVEKTRKEFYTTFAQRAYPQNGMIVSELLEKRNKQADLLGFSNFASYQLHNQMIKNPKKVEQFLWNVVSEVQKQDHVDYQELTKSLPASVSLTKDKKVKPWDQDFLVSMYQKEHFKKNHSNFSEYFELDHTVEQLLDLLHTFFYVKFEKQDLTNADMWGSDVTCYRVRLLRQQTIAGYLFFDLHKRPGKKVQVPSFMPILSALKDDCSLSCAGAAVVAAGFKQTEKDLPILLSLQEMKMLFEQMANALHHLFGCAQFVDITGRSSSQDFLKITSAMFDYWLEEPKFLHKVSKHYLAGKPLSKDKIEQIIAAGKFGKSQEILQELFYGILGLQIYKDHSLDMNHKKVEKLYKKIFKHKEYDQQMRYEYNHPEFIHDGALYYQDILAKIIAADIFTHIQQHDIFNSEAGKDFKQHMLDHGAAMPAEDMLKKFLKRPYSQKAFVQRIE